MKKLILMLMIISATASAATITAFKTGERVTGSTKQCYYQGNGAQYTTTIRSYELCPLTIEVEV